MIRCENIFFEYEVASGATNQFSLKCSAFAAEPGKIAFVLGGNGTGKTTFLRLLAGQLTPKSGDVRTASARIGWIDVRAANNLVDSLTVIDHLALSLHSAQQFVPWIPRNASDSFYKEKLNFLGKLKDEVAGLLKKRVFELSGGQRQLLSITLAMVGERNVLLADESTANLDVVNANAFFSCLRQLCKEECTAVVAVTHDLLLASEFGDSFYHIRGGTVEKLKLTAVGRDRLECLQQILIDGKKF